MTVSPNDIRFTLEIEFDIHPAAIRVERVFVLNPEAQLKDIKVGDITRYCSQTGEHINFTDEELNTLIIYDKENIEFKCLSGIRKTFNFPNKKATIKEFVDAIVEFEKVSRPLSDCFGGINHIYYEGIFGKENDTYMIFWGS